MSGLPAGILAALQRLERAGIRILPVAEISSHYVLERDGFAALVEREGEQGFGQIGSAGLVTDEGLAVLVWEGERPWFVTRSGRREATSREVASLRAFATAVTEALTDFRA